MLPQPITRTLVADEVYDALVRAIVNGELRAGSRLRVRDVAADVGTSVMPVREAIARLERDGLAERHPHRGAVVHGLSADELVAVYEVRRLLEVEAARGGAAAISDAGYRAMRGEYELLRAAAAEGRSIAYLDHDEQLLTTLYDANGNQVLLDLIRGLWRRCRAYKLSGVPAPGPRGADPSLWRPQRDLLTAARRGDPAAATTAVEASLRAAEQRIRTSI